MNKDFATFEQALVLKELGFDEPCFCTFHNKQLSRNPSHKMGSTPITEKPYTWQNSKTHNSVVTAPLKQQVFRWFREKHDLFGCIDLQVCTPSHWYVRVDVISKNDYVFHSEDEQMKWETYEEAESACIDKLIEIVKSQQKT